MKVQNKNQSIKRLIFSHTGQILNISLAIIIAMSSSMVFAGSMPDGDLESQLTYQSNSGASRAPASFIPNDEVEPVPFEQKIWLQNVLVEDDAGVLKQIRADLQYWQSREEYAQTWDIKSTGLYETPSNGAIKSYLTKKMLRYFDKRLMNKVKKAEEGSTLRKVGQVQQALRPNTKVSVGKNIKVKFRAKVLRGSADIIVDNPYVEYKTSLNYNGEINMDMKKDIKALGVQARLNYQVDQHSWYAALDRKLTDKITATISSHQSDKEMAFEGSANKILQFSYSHSF